MPMVGERVNEAGRVTAILRRKLTKASTRPSFAPPDRCGKGPESAVVRRPPNRDRRFATHCGRSTRHDKSGGFRGTTEFRGVALKYGSSAITDVQLQGALRRQQVG